MYSSSGLKKKIQICVKGICVPKQSMCTNFQHPSMTEWGRCDREALLNLKPNFHHYTCKLPFLIFFQIDTGISVWSKFPGIHHRLHYFIAAALGFHFCASALKNSCKSDSSHVRPRKTAESGANVWAEHWLYQKMGRASGFKKST